MRLGLCAALVFAPLGVPGWAEVNLPGDQPGGFIHKEENGGSIVAGSAEVIWSPDATNPTLRLRYLSKKIGKGGHEYDFAAASVFMQSHCDSDGIAIASERFPTGDLSIIVSYMKEYVEFGATAPDVTQYFEAYDRIDGKCVVSEF